jgi:exocyst complex component 3
VHVLNFDSYCELLQVMIDFQAAEKKRVDEPASDIGLEPLCAMVCQKI